MPPQKSSHFLVAAARARVARHVNPASEEILDVLNSESASESDLEVTTWTGGVDDHTFLSRDAWTEDSDDEGSLPSEANSVEIITSLEKQASVEVSVIEKAASALDSLMGRKTSAEWNKAESNQASNFCFFEAISFWIATKAPSRSPFLFSLRRRLVSLVDTSSFRRFGGGW